MTTPSNPEAPALSVLVEELRKPFQQISEEFEVLRPALYRYYRYLTHTPRDAEDLVQDTLMRAFTVLATSHDAPTNPKAWLFRVASNRWLNWCKRRREVPQAPHHQSAYSPADAQATREAAGSLVAGLSPQERAALVLKDMFDFSLEEVAVTLSTSVGAVKAALHRARGKMKEPMWRDEPAVAPQVISDFCDAFNARDLDRVLSLLLDTTDIELSGTFVGGGLELAKRSFGGLLFATPMAMNAGIRAEYRGNIQAEPPRFTLHMHRGAPLVLTVWKHDDGDHVRGVSLFETADDHITGIKTYMHSPELIAEVCTELGLTFRTNGYRNWN